MQISDTYSGHVEPGGDAAARTLGSLRITKISVGMLDNNAYLLRCLRTGDALLIDAADQADRLLDLLGHDADRPRLRTVVTTHRHADHWQALGAVAGATGSATVAHPLDAPELPVPPDLLVEQGDKVTVGEVALDVVHLRGHTPGSIALVHHDSDGSTHLFTGDSLFPGGVGRTTSPEAFTSLLGDVRTRLFDVLPDDTWFYPGHGDDSTLGAQRPKLAEWGERGW